jgi:hypothetical protein
MKLHLLLKSWLLSALFIFVASKSIAAELLPNISKSQLLAIAESTRWQKLLQLDQGRTQINDPNFLLSLPNFSALNELKATLALINSAPAIAQCKFPARYFYLSKELRNPIKLTTSFLHCKELSLYLKAVPFDKVSLVFASETLASTTSMMGHVFFKAEGKNQKNTQVAHSIAFFSEISNFNPFKLIYDGLIGGMDGFLLVRPFQFDRNNYINREGRNLWQYQLSLSQYQKDLMRLHFWELKDIEITYLFQSFNCATLTLNVLQIAEPKLKNDKQLFVTPTDVVRAINQQNLIAASSVELAPAWQASMIQQTSPQNLIEIFQKTIEKQNTTDLAKLSQQEKRLAKLYFTSLQKTDKNNKFFDNALQAQLNKQLQLDSNLSQINNYKNPTNSPKDSQVKISHKIRDNINVSTFAFAPASHYLLNNNKQYFSESELLMGEVAVNYNWQYNKVKLESLTLYSMTSLTPSVKFMPQWSNSFYLGYREFNNNNGSYDSLLNMSGSIGKAYNIHPDIINYYLLELGVAANFKNQFMYFQPKVGLIAHLLFSTKLNAEYSAAFNHYSDKHANQKLSIDLTHYFSPDVSFFLSYKKEKFNNTLDTFTLGVIYSF